MKIHAIKKHLNSSSRSTLRVSYEEKLPTHQHLQKYRINDYGLKTRNASDSVTDLSKILEEEEN